MAVHAFVNVHIKIQSTALPSKLKIIFEQHLETGVIIRNLASCVLIHGASIIVSKQASGAVEHTIRVVFLSEGTYHLALVNDSDDTVAWPFRIRAAILDSDDA